MPARSSSRGAASAAPSLDELAEKIKALNEKADSSQLSHALKVGDLLIQAKTQVPHGQWETWVRETLGMARTTSALYMRLAAANVRGSAHFKSISEADRATRKPRKEQPPAKERKAGPTLAGKRRHQARMGRTDAKRNGRPLGFWEIGWDVSRLVYALAGWKVEAVDLGEDNVATMLTVEEDLLYLYDWMDDTITLIHSRIGEDKLRNQIKKLRDKTVANGCTVEEAEAAARAADRLQRKVDNRLAA